MIVYLSSKSVKLNPSWNNFSRTRDRLRTTNCNPINNIKANIEFIMASLDLFSLDFYCYSKPWKRLLICGSFVTSFNVRKFQHSFLSIFPFQHRLTSLHSVNKSLHKSLSVLTVSLCILSKFLFQNCFTVLCPVMFLTLGSFVPFHNNEI